MARRDSASVGYETTLQSEASPPKDGSHLVPGQNFDQYTILSILGQGGMGKVYAAYDPKLDRRVALKILKTTSDSQKADSAARRRLLREAKALAKLSHPNVVGVFDVGEVDSQVFIAMEFIDGRHLGQWIKEESPDWKQVINAIQLAACGLAAAHEIGLVHRDIKPENIVVSAKGEVRVIDFGIARTFRDKKNPTADRKDVVLRSDSITEMGTIIGTPQYMAREQFYGDSSAHSDQSSLALCLYEALYGHIPFVGTSSHARVKSLETPLERPTNRKVPPWIFEVIRKALSPNPSNRFDKIESFHDALQDPSSDEDEARLRSVEREHNPYFKSRSRSHAGVALLVLKVGEIFFTFARSYDLPYTPFSPFELLLQGAVLVFGVGVVLLFWRSTFWANHYNRRWAMVALGTASLLFLHRLVGVIADRDPTQTLQSDNFLLVVCVLMSANLSLAFYGVGAVILVLAGIGARDAHWARLTLNLSAVIYIVSIFLLWRRASQQALHKTNTLEH